MRSRVGFLQLLELQETPTYISKFAAFKARCIGELIPPGLSSVLVHLSDRDVTQEKSRCGYAHATSFILMGAGFHAYCIRDG